MSTDETTDGIRLSILGMRCAGCVSAVEGALAAVDGVTSVSVNFADHSAMIKGQADPDALKQAIKAAGFDAAVMEGLEDPAEQESIERQTVHVFHGEEPGCSVGDQLVQGDQVGMVDVGNGAEFALESVQVGCP